MLSEGGKVTETPFGGSTAPLFPEGRVAEGTIGGCIDDNLACHLTDIQEKALEGYLDFLARFGHNAAIVARLTTSTRILNQGRRECPR